MRKQVTGSILLAALLAAGMLTGCGADKETPGNAKVKTEHSHEKKEEKAQKEAGKKHKGDGEVYEVSRENFDDCDGSGHGYTEIQYSDGSTEIEEY